jgi:hypothetical protein
MRFSKLAQTVAAIFVVCAFLLPTVVVSDSHPPISTAQDWITEWLLLFLFIAVLGLIAGAWAISAYWG